VDKAKYIEQRTELIAQVDDLIKETKVEESNVIMAQIEELDNEWEAIKLENANKNAMEEVKKPLDLEEVNIKTKEVEVMENINIKELEGVEMVATMEYKNAFLKKLQGKELTQQENALVSASGVIPTETMDKIIEKMEYVAPLLAKIDLSRIPSNLSIPVEGTVNDASWVAMGTASTDSADTITTVSLAAYKLIKTVEIGADVEVMAIGAFESYLVDRLAHKMAKALENAVINGTGSTQPTGLLAAGVITNTGTFTLAAMTYADLLTVIADLPDHGYRVGAQLVMPSALFYSDVLPALTDKGSGLDVQAVEKMKVLGYDVILCDRVAADTIVFGNLENYAMNMSSDVKVEADKSVGFRTGSTVYRAMALVDGKVKNAAAFNVYTRALT